MNDPLDLLLMMSYSGVMAVIFYRLSNHKGLRRWWVMRTAPIRGRVGEWQKQLRRVDWVAVNITILMLLTVILSSMALGTIWATIYLPAMR